MRFRNRQQAAELLAERLSAYRGTRPLVLGVPRGAVPMARIIADDLGGDLDVVLARKLRAPGQPELAIGAVDEGGHVVKGVDYFDIASDEVRQGRNSHSAGSYPQEAGALHTCPTSDRSLRTHRDHCR